MRYALTVSLLALTLAGCGGQNPTSPQPAAEKKPLTPEQMKSARAVAEGNNQFALDLYRRLSGKPGNVFFSPHSISTALTMTYAGARGETADEMAKVLHFSLPPGELHPAVAALMEHTRSTPASGYELRVANALWPQKGFGLLEDFLKVQEEHYQARPRELDFQGATEDARKTINDWTAQETNGKITDLIQPNVLTPDTMLVLTNAIYFKGSWNSKFEASSTRQEDFFVSAEKKVKVPMMYQHGEFRHYADARVQMLEMPYAGEEISMVVVLPSERNALAGLEKDLTGEKLTQWMGKMHQTKVHTHLPRWKMSLGVELSRELAAMGMPLATSASADFSGINGKTGLWINEVIHKAFVEVNEEGTEAAAATAVAVGKSAVDMPDPQFRADQPFMFLIRDSKTGCILFLGRVEDPSR